MSVFKGAGVAIVTPMYDNEEVNYDKLGELLEEQIARGTDAIIICGTTGEASTLTHEEHLAVIKYCRCQGSIRQYFSGGKADEPCKGERRALFRKR